MSSGGQDVFTGLRNAGVGICLIIDEDIDIRRNSRRKHRRAGRELFDGKYLYLSNFCYTIFTLC
jgi:hypothetical protein